MVSCLFLLTTFVVVVGVLHIVDAVRSPLYPENGQMSDRLFDFSFGKIINLCLRLVKVFLM
jgi:hypothetical protein